MSEGKIVSKEHIVNGDGSPFLAFLLAPRPHSLKDLSNATDALKMLFDGRNDGKLIVRIDPSVSATSGVLNDIRARASKL